jgi:hypothetical protein
MTNWICIGVGQFLPEETLSYRSMVTRLANPEVKEAVVPKKEKRAKAGSLFRIVWSVFRNERNYRTGSSSARLPPNTCALEEQSI